MRCERVFSFSFSTVVMRISKSLRRRLRPKRCRGGFINSERSRASMDHQLQVFCLMLILARLRPQKQWNYSFKTSKRKSILMLSIIIALVMTQFTRSAPVSRFISRRFERYKWKQTEIIICKHQTKKIILRVLNRKIYIDLHAQIDFIIK